MFFAKNWSWAVFTLILLSLSCTEDDPFRSDDIIVAPPDLRLSDDGEFVARNDTIDYNCSFVLELDGQQGDFVMRTLTITIDSVLVDPSKILISNEPATNPYMLSVIDTASFLLQIEITPEAVAQEEVEYIFEVTDELGTSEDISIRLKTVNGLDPELTTTSDFDQPVAVDSIFFISVDGKANCEDLTSLSFYKDGSLLDPSSIQINASSIESNPWIIDEFDTEYFSQSFILAGNATADSFYYEIVLEDTSGAKDTVDYQVRTGDFVEVDTEIILSNFAKDRIIGAGLDLEVGSPDSVFLNVDIQASGIDTLLDTQNDWKPQIRAVNGTQIGELRLGENGLSEDFDYVVDILLKEDLATLFTKTELIPGEEYTDVAKFEEYIVKQDTNYYLIEIKDITIDTSSNNDFILLNIWR